MAGAKIRKELSDGELSDDGGAEGGLDTSICKTCNLTFANSKVSSFLFYESVSRIALLYKHCALCIVDVHFTTCVHLLLSDEKCHC